MSKVYNQNKSNLQLVFGKTSKTGTVVTEEENNKVIHQIKAYDVPEITINGQEENDVKSER